MSDSCKIFLDFCAAGNLDEVSQRLSANPDLVNARYTDVSISRERQYFCPHYPWYTFFGIIGFHEHFTIWVVKLFMQAHTQGEGVWGVRTNPSLHCVYMHTFVTWCCNMTLLSSRNSMRMGDHADYSFLSFPGPRSKFSEGCTGPLASSPRGYAPGWVSEAWEHLYTVKPERCHIQFSKTHELIIKC